MDWNDKIFLYNYYKVYQETYKETEKGKLVRQKAKKNYMYSGKALIQLAVYRKRYPDRRKAHTCVERLLSNNQIEKPKECSFCKKTCVPIAHHDDYGKPNIFVWICRKCHGDLHRKMRAAQ